MASRTPLLLLVTALAQAQMTKPEYGGGNRLLRPGGYREWVFVGSSLGMGYKDEAAAENPAFHHVYIQAQAYRHYARTGQFPDKTMLVMEVVAPGTNASINRRGRFGDRFVGIEVAVKDTQRFPEKWAYFDFIGDGGKPLAEATPLPQKSCWNCHRQHGEVDNVFVQFYPVLRDLRPKK
ncbi:MAG: cytochrome P460 [Acidobacteria bacterium]|nr:cytochrome P460 [Acidobacteriota bacterium]